VEDHGESSKLRKSMIAGECPNSFSQPVSGVSGTGIDEAMEWFTTVLRENRRTQRAARKGHERSKSNV
jgi:hypothetical protein